MGHYEQYKLWLEGDFTDERTKFELESIKENLDEIEDRFYKDLDFGTAGLRGIIGAGTNRMNIYTVSRASEGLAKYLLKKYGQKESSVAIAYDCRHMSKEFAMKASEVFAFNGIRVYLFDDLRPTPELSYAVRNLECKAGIVITASHNSAKYNGFKVYNENGAQILDQEAVDILEEIQTVGYDFLSTVDNIDSRFIQIGGKEIDSKYVDRVKCIGQCPVFGKNNDNITIVYTPLHGAGNILVRRVLKEKGFSNVYVVKEQELPDPDFSTVKLPNPEDVEAFSIGVELAYKVGADIVIGTDPDCDRVGVMVRNRKTNEYEAMTGNEIGALLTYYLLSKNKEKGVDLSKAYIVNTVVTSDLGEKIAKSFGVKIVKTLTGFKYIANEIKQRENSGEHFILGYEESYGYLAGDFVRDKDGVIASMLIAEMTSYYAYQNKTLLDVMEEIYLKYNYHIEKTVSIQLEGIIGKNKIEKIIEFFRENKPNKIANFFVEKIIDYKYGTELDFKTGDCHKLDYPKSNVLKFYVENGGWFAIRPSGTEPKLKIYYSFNGITSAETVKKIEEVEKDIYSIMDRIA